MSGDPGSLLRAAIRDGIVPPAPDLFTEQAEELFAEVLLTGRLPAGMLVGFSSRPLRAGERVRHGDGLVTHTSSSNSRSGQVFDAVMQWTVAVEVPAAGLILRLNDAGTLEQLG